MEKPHATTDDLVNEEEEKVSLVLETQCNQMFFFLYLPIFFSVVKSAKRKRTPKKSSQAAGSSSSKRSAKVLFNSLELEVLNPYVENCEEHVCVGLMCMKLSGQGT